MYFSSEKSSFVIYNIDDEPLESYQNRNQDWWKTPLDITNRKEMKRKEKKFFFKVEYIFSKTSFLKVWISTSRHNCFLRTSSRFEFELFININFLWTENICIKTFPIYKLNVPWKKFWAPKSCYGLQKVENPLPSPS